MTPLKAAQMMMEQGLFDNGCGDEYEHRCVFCRVERGDPHRNDCPAPAIPKIVAALEAAERVTVEYEDQRVLFGTQGREKLMDALKALDEALDEALNA